MMKKIVSLLLVATMAMSLVACGGAKEEQTEAPAAAATEEAAPAEEAATEEAATEEAAPAEEAAADYSEIKIGIVTDVGGVNDGSFNQSSWEGLTRASEDLGVQVKYLESKTDADYAPNIETFIDEEYDLIICVGFMLADAT